MAYGTISGLLQILKKSKMKLRKLRGHSAGIIASNKLLEKAEFNIEQNT